MRKILFIDSSDVGAAYSAEAAKLLDFEPVFLVNLNNFQGDTKREILKYQYYQVDTDSIDALLKIIAENNITDIEGIITMLDSKLDIAIELANYLKVRMMDNAIKKITNKLNVAQLIPEFSPETIGFKKSELLNTEIIYFLRNFSKILLKPAKGAGGFAKKIFIQSTTEEIINYCHNYNVDEWIINELIVGDLFSLEGFVIHGNPRFLGFSLRGKVTNTETTNLFPADNHIPAKMQNRAQLAVAELIKCSQFSHGYFHAEFIINEEECYLIDANCGRIGGGAVSENIACAYGLAPTDIYRHIILTTLFPEADIQDIYKNKPSVETFAIHYGIPAAAKLKSIEANISEKTKHTCLLDTGASISVLGENNWSWVGILSGFKEDVLQDIEKIKILTEEGNFGACY